MVNDNLLKNTRLAVNTDRWVLGVNVTRDPSKTLYGCASIKSEQRGLISDAWRGAYNAPYIPCSPGEDFMASVWVYVSEHASFEGIPVMLEVNYFDKNNSRVQVRGQALYIGQEHVGRWTRIVCNLKATHESIKQARLYCYIRRNGTAWFACPKLERGSVATPYTPSHWEDWTTPIIDRTQEDIQQRNPKAFCNVRDLQRLEENIECLADVIGSSCNLKLAPWKRNDFPKTAEFARILANITALRQAYYSYSHSPSVPLPPFNTWQKWNDAEQLLLDIYTIWNENQAARSYAGELYSGQQIGVI